MSWIRCSAFLIFSCQITGSFSSWREEKDCLIARVLATNPSLRFAQSMVHCYRCGMEIEGKNYKRRKVKTGEWIRRRYPRKTVAALNVHYGLRIVCNRCARQIDLDYRRGELMEWLKIAAALLVLFVFLYLNSR